MITVEEFYALVGEDFNAATDAEKSFAGLQIQVAEDAIRNYTRRHIDPMVWEDRFQRPDVVVLFETPTLFVEQVVADGHQLPEDRYYFHGPTSRLFSVHDGFNFHWPWGNMTWLSDQPPETMPQYYGNWRGVGSLKVLYKAGFIPVPMVLKQICADYTYERVLARRALASSGGTPIPVGTISQIQIEGVGTVRYSEGASTTSNASYRAQRAGEAVIGAAGTLLNAYLEVAVVVPGLRGLVSHRPVTPVVMSDLVTYSDLPTDLVRYSDAADSYVTYANSNGSSGLTLMSANPQQFSLWNGIYINGTVWDV